MCEIQPEFYSPGGNVNNPGGNTDTACKAIRTLKALGPAPLRDKMCQKATQGRKKFCFPGSFNKFPKSEKCVSMYVLSFVKSYLGEAIIY